MVAKIFETITSVITQFITSLTTALNGVIDIFYQEETGLTVLGTLLLISLGMGIVYWGFRLIRNLIG